MSEANRLDNIQSVEPILSAMKTISMGSQQAALNQKARVKAYLYRLSRIQAVLFDQLKTKPGEKVANGGRNSKPPRVIVLAIGSERGLCGQFNRLVFERANQIREEMGQKDEQAEWWVLGKRLLRLFQIENLHCSWTGSLSITSLPSYALAVRLSQDWLRDYEAMRLDQVDVVYNGLDGGNRLTLIPLQMEPQAHHLEGADEEWALPIIETDPRRLLQRTMEQVVICQTYTCLLDSAAAEHVARFRLMDEATQNAQRLMEELQMELLSAKRQMVTREMQELAVGAGLLKR